LSSGAVPVYGILFGRASEDQLVQMAEATSGRVFDGRDDLIGALRDAKGNN
jgi:Ca-activated chloride channel family protein